MMLVSVLALLTLAACGNDDAKIVQEDVTRVAVEGAPTEMPTPDPVALTAEAATAEAEAADDGETTGATPAAGGAAEITLEAYDIGWRTADQDGPQVDLTVAPGAVINLVNTGGAEHNFEAADLGIDEDMPVGYSGSVTIPADAALGTYDFICNIPGHAQAGMVGTITIAEDAGGALPAGGSPPQEEEPAAGGDAGAVAEQITLEAYDIGWRTAEQQGPQVELTVAPGTTIELVNTGGAEHDFSLDDRNNEGVPNLEIDVDMPQGFSGTVEIPADTPPGTYYFYCDIPGHEAAGMHGTIIVQ
jgi:nitrite reductase (NO-forming)